MMDERDHSEFDLRACLVGVGRRDADASEALVRHLYPVILPIIRRRLPRGLDAEDMTQEVLMKIFAKWDQFRGNADSFHAWARRIAFTCCLNRIRWNRLRPEIRWADLDPRQVEVIEQVVVDGQTPDPGQRTQARELVRLLLDHLRPKERLLIEMLELEGHSVARVAELTGWSRVNIRVRALRARAKLRQRLKQLLNHETKIIPSGTSVPPAVCRA